ncbi:MAG: DUF3267 domain-containing protein [Lewinellaceae bacterium]|nr:DUF3267 domain-containing protein [Saprospiraceae bacterium]MCB9312299.1 DUF3267 domain-containing protein [Lewinellaceae bacterium]
MTIRRHTGPQITRPGRDQQGERPARSGWFEHLRWLTYLRGMKIHPSQLEAAGYVQKEALVHEELVAFIRVHLQVGNRWTRGYTLANLLAFGLVAGLIFVIVAEGGDILDEVSRIGLGFALAFLLVVPHEWIHGLAYRWVGAPNIRYTAIWKKFIFTAQAPDFVANAREFRIVALAPFVLISTALLILFLLIPDHRLMISSMLLTHTAFCSGDIGLLSYFHQHRQEALVTYDDADGLRSYFYVKPD